MILDESLEFCDATALNTGAAGTYLIGDQIPLTVARDIGVGQPPLYLVIQVTTTVTSGGSATVQFILASDDSASVSTSTSTQHIVTPAIPKASLVAGAVFIYPLPMEGNTYEEYLGLLQVTGVAALTAGAINAFITEDVSKWKAYPDATN